MAHWAALGTYIVLGIVVVLLAAALVQQHILLPRRPVARVNGVGISLRSYQEYYRYRRWSVENTIQYLEAQRLQLSADEVLASLVPQIDQQISEMNYQLQMLPNDALDEMIDDELVRQEAAKRGLVASGDEVQREIETLFGYDRNPPVAEEPTAAPSPTESAAITETGTLTEAQVPAEPTPTPAPTEVPMTEEEFQARAAEWFAAVKDVSGLEEAAMRELVRCDLLQNKLVEDIRAQTPTVAEQVHVRHIVLNTEDEAKAALERLRAGEDWNTLAAELSQDTLTKDEGGDLGWLTRGTRGDAFDEVAFALEPGTLSEVVPMGVTFEVIEVLEKDPARPLDADQLSSAQSRAVSEWFAQARTGEGIERLLESSMIPS